jgi:saccharopine dehydrogenase-like NADP-dependent oxidoreductase
MTQRKCVLIIGGYGNFGGFITEQLSGDENLDVIVAGRSLVKASAFAAKFPSVDAAMVDVGKDIASTLSDIGPDIVIHTSGPFQGQGYDVARACIGVGSHYIDLADGRDFVTGITSLDDAAKAKGVAVISGASSVPCLTSAIIDHHLDQFHRLESVDYGITTAQKTNRGLATTAAILSYVGKPFTTLNEGRATTVYGWQDIRSRRYPRLGRRYLGNCDVPDLVLFPDRYPDLKSIRFAAGIEVPCLHIGLWGLSWLVRIGLITRLERGAPFMLSAARLFDFLGSASSAFHMTMTGKGADGEDKTIAFDLTARAGDGPYIPCTPAILLATKLAEGAFKSFGAKPCVGLIDMAAYLAALEGLEVSWTVTES